MIPSPKIAYVVKRYPRFSETFIVNEILAHERAGLDLEIVAIRPCTDTHFQDRIALVQAPLTVLPSAGVRGEAFWGRAHRVARRNPRVWEELAEAESEDFLDVYQALELAEFIHDRHITHLHAHFASTSASVARLASRITGVPFTFTAHAKDIYHESVSSADLQRKLRDAATTITVSDFNLAHLKNEFGEDAARVVRVYNGLDLEQFAYQPPRPDTHTILAVGRMVEKKGFHVLLAACAELRRRGVDFHCEFIGQGEEERRLREMASRLELEELVDFRGPQPQAEVIRAMQQSAVLATPCVVGKDGNRDGMPTVLLEAMALGTPCVATEVTGIPEAMTDGEHGLVVAPDDPLALADALERVLRDFPLRQQLALGARRRVEEHFQVTRAAEHLRRIFALAALDRTTNSSPRRQAALAEAG